MEKVKLAEVTAIMAHCGQRDKGGHPYIMHPKTVASMVSGSDAKAVAWLHDVVEDTSITVEEIRRQFGEKIASAVDAITRRDGEDRSVYLNRVKKNPLARVVKIADLIHNSDLSRISCSRPITNRDVYRVWRYMTEVKYLSEGSDPWM